MGSTPETPFLLTRWTRFTPAFQTDADDADIGADGTAIGAYFIVGHTMVIQATYLAAGAGADFGSGDFRIPMPPGFTTADLDARRMPPAESGEGIEEGAVIVLVGMTHSGTSSARFALATVELNTETGEVEAAIVTIDGYDTLVSGDGFSMRLELPIIEPALPG